MRVKSISIILEPHSEADEKQNPGGTTITYSGHAWKIDGPLYKRDMEMLEALNRYIAERK